MVLSPRLSLQAYAQLFSSYGIFGPFYEARPAPSRSTIRFGDLQPSSWPDSYSFYETQLNLNVVLRWEYGLGSILYAIYTRQQLGAYQPGGPAASRTVLPVNLFGGRPRTP